MSINPLPNLFSRGALVKVMLIPAGTRVSRARDGSFELSLHPKIRYRGLTVPAVYAGMTQLCLTRCIKIPVPKFQLKALYPNQRDKVRIGVNMKIYTLIYISKGIP